MWRVQLVILDDDSKGKKEIDEESFDEDEYYAWHELRLHHLVMKSIYRLGFKNPTPIQKACIPAAAHQGKDVVGAAETGSGKTLLVCPFCNAYWMKKKRL